MEGIYDKLFPFLEKHAYQEEDANFLFITETLDLACSKGDDDEKAEFDLWEVLTIPPHFQCDQSDTISLFYGLMNRARNPFDKMKCVKQTTDNIVFNINKYQSNSKTEFVTTDDLIPLLAYIIVRAKVPNLITNLNFMQEYQLEEHGLSEYGFSVTTLYATIMFLKSEIFAKNESQWRKFKKKQPKQSTTPSHSSKTLDIEPYLTSPRAKSEQSTPNTTPRREDEEYYTESISAKTSPSSTVPSLDLNTNNMSPLYSTDGCESPQHEQVDNLSGLLSPRDSRNLALKQKRQEERQKRMSLRKLESIAIIKSFENKLPSTDARNDSRKY